MVGKEKTGKDVIFYTDETMTEVTFYRSVGGNFGGNFDDDKYKELTERQKNILKTIQTGQITSANDVAVTLNLAKRTVERELSYLKAQEYIIKEGKQNKGRWVILK